MLVPESSSCCRCQFEIKRQVVGRETENERGAGRRKQQREEVSEANAKCKCNMPHTQKEHEEQIVTCMRSRASACRRSILFLLLACLTAPDQRFCSTSSPSFTETQPIIKTSLLMDQHQQLLEGNT